MAYRKHEGTEMIVSATGEVMNVASYRTVGQVEGFERIRIKTFIQKDYEILTGRNFSFFNQDAVELYSQNMDEEYLKVFGAVMLLSAYLPMDGTGKLPQTSQKEIAEPLQMSEAQTKVIISKAQEMNLIQRVRNEYFINNDLVHRGTLKNSTGTVKAFHKVIRVLRKNMKLHQIGFLFLILPFISYDYHIICKNPEKADLEQIEGMNMEELGHCVGLNKSTVGRKIKSMTFEYEGMVMSAFAFFINPVSSKRLIVVNPALFSRTTSESWKDTLNLFIISR